MSTEPKGQTVIKNGRRIDEYHIDIECQTWEERWGLFWLYFKFTFEILLRGHTWLHITERRKAP